MARDSKRYKVTLLLKQESLLEPIHSLVLAKTVAMPLHDRVFSEGMQCTISWSELTVVSMLDSRAEIRENTIKFFMETEFCEFSPELEDHFEIFEHIRGFNVTIVTSADTKDETSLLWSGFMLNDEGETK